MWAAPKGNVALDACLLRGLLGLWAAQADQERPDWILQNLKPEHRKKSWYFAWGLWMPAGPAGCVSNYFTSQSDNSRGSHL